MANYKGGPEGTDYVGRATCPFFRGASQRDRTVTCEGLYKSTAMRTVFLRDPKADKWRRTLENLCCENWEDCRLAHQLLQLYDKGVLE